MRNLHPFDNSCAMYSMDTKYRGVYVATWVTRLYSNGELSARVCSR